MTRCEGSYGQTSLVYCGFSEILVAYTVQWGPNVWGNIENLGNNKTVSN